MTVGLRALNDALRSAFDAPGRPASPVAARRIDQPPAEEPERLGGDSPPAGALGGAMVSAAIRFKQSPVRLHPGEQRTISLLFDPVQVPPGTPIEIAADTGLSVSLRQSEGPEPLASGWSRVSGKLRALVSAEPGSRLSVFAEAGGRDAELVVIVVRHRGAGWVREIARKDDDSAIEAEFEPEDSGS